MNEPKPKAKLPSWIVVTAKDPKLAKAIEEHLAETLIKGNKLDEQTRQPEQ